MPLTVVLGRKNAGKSTFLRTRFFESARALYIVPEQTSHETEYLLTRHAGILTDKKRVLSFHRMAGLLLNHMAGGRVPLSKVGEKMLAAMVLRETNDRLTILKNAFQKPGCAASLLSEITRLKRYLNTPSMLKSAAEKTDDTLLCAKAMDMSVLFQAFETRMRAHYIDRDDELSILASHIEQFPFLTETEFFFDEFTGFTPAEFSVIEALLKKGASLTVSLCLEETDSQNPAFFTAQRTFSRLRMLETPRVISLTASESSVPEDLAYLERHFWTPSLPAYQKEAPHVRVFYAKTAETEAAYIADKIVELTKNGLRYRDILLLCRAPQTYEQALKDAFSVRNIPCFFDKKEPVTRHPVILYLLSALELITKGFAYHCLFHYVKSGFTDITEEEAAVLENYVLAAGIRGSAWTSEEKWAVKKELFLTKNPDEDTELDRIDDIRRRLIVPLIGLKEAMASAKTAQEKCTAFYNFVQERRLAQKLTEHALLLRQLHKPESADRMVAVMNAFIETLDALCALFGEETISTETFAYLMENGLAAAMVGIIPSTLDAVQLSDVARFRGDGKKAVFLLGVNDGVFPAAAISTGIFSDRDFRKLSKGGLTAPPDAREIANEEMSLIYLALTAPKERLYISCATAGETALLPSFILWRIRRLLPHVKTDNDFLQDDTKLPEAPLPAFYTLAQKLRQSVETKTPMPALWQQIYGYFLQVPNYRALLDSVLDALDGTEIHETLSPKTASWLYEKTDTTSVSRLETYKKCPFSYFVNYVLKLQKRPDTNPSAMDIGNFLHAAVEAFTRTIAEDPDRTWQTADDTYIDEQVDRICAELTAFINPYRLANSRRLVYLLERLHRAAARTIRLIRAHIVRGLFEPLGAEIEFDSHQKYVPLTIPLPDGKKLKLRGKVDRADVYTCEKGSFIRIIDYKTGSPANGYDLSVSDIYQGLSLQLMVYLTAFSEQPDQSYRGAGLLYFRLDDPLIEADFEAVPEAIEETLLNKTAMKGLLLDDNEVLTAMGGRNCSFITVQKRRLLTEEEIKLLSRSVKLTVGEIVKEMRRGNVDRHPRGKKDHSPCTFCAMKGLCGFIPSCGHQEEVVPALAREDVFAALKEDLS